MERQEDKRYLATPLGIIQRGPEEISMDFGLFFDGARRSILFAYVRSRAEKNDAKDAELTRPSFHPRVETGRGR